MRRKDIAGVYKIVSPSGKVYIGRSYMIKQRWRSYQRLDCADQPKLYASFIKYGVDNHEFTIIHILPKDIHKSIIEQYEVIYYNLYKVCGVSFLNLAPTGKGIGKLTEAQSKKAGSYHIGVSTWTKGKFGKDHNRSIGITCNGISYGSLAEASRVTGIAVSNIHHSITKDKPLRRSGMHFQLSSI